MSEDGRLVKFNEDNWIAVETLAENAGQSPQEYLFSAIEIGLFIASIYREHKVAGYTTHLLFQVAPQAEKFDRFNVDLTDLPAAPEAPQDQGLVLDPFTAVAQSIELDDETHKNVAAEVQALSVNRNDLLSWFFNVKAMIDQRLVHGQRVLINNTTEGSYKEIGFMSVDPEWN